MRVAVVGAGWAGLAAAVRAVQAGHDVTLHEMAPRAGGRARSDHEAPGAADNGQHVLLGGYARTLQLIREVGIDPATALARHPLALRHADDTGFALTGRGLRAWDIARTLLGAHGFSIADKIAAARTAAAWKRAAFECDPALTVAALLGRTATPRLRMFIFDPLCEAALNTPPEEASAQVFLAVIRDSLFGERAASDLLVPRVPLAALLPSPAWAWLAARGALVHLRSRVRSVCPADGGWRLDVAGDDGSAAHDSIAIGPASSPQARFDAVILAAPPWEAARLTQDLAPAWSRDASLLEHEPIATVWLDVPARPWPLPVMAFARDAACPAQFAFRSAPPTDAAVAGAGASDRARQDGVVLVSSAARKWAARGIDALCLAAMEQMRIALALRPADDVRCVGARIERRATFLCTPGLRRPAMRIAPGLLAAGDYVAGPYPATLEAAVRAGEAAALALP